MNCDQELWHIFHNELDLDSNGHLDAEELTVALQKAGELHFILYSAVEDLFSICTFPHRPPPYRPQAYKCPHRCCPTL
jgi:hypothetical protein